MPIDYSLELKKVRSKHAALNFIKTDPLLIESLGVYVSLVYGAIQYRLSALLDPSESTYKTIIENENWFYLPQEKICELTGLKQQTVSDAIQKMVDAGIFEKKKTNSIPRINLYRELDWEFDFLDMSIVSLNQYTTDGHRQNQLIPGAGIKTPGAGNITRGYDIKKRNIKAINKDKNPLGGEGPPLGRRRSIPGYGGNTSKTELPNDKIYYYCKTLYELIHQFHPRFEETRTWKKCAEKWYKALSKICKKAGRENKRNLLEAILWVYTCDDRDTEFFRKNFQSIPGLANVWKKGKPDETTMWKQILKAYMGWKGIKEFREGPIEEVLNTHIENMVYDYVDKDTSKKWKRDEIEEEIQTMKDSIGWFVEQLDEISEERPPQYQFNWQKKRKFIIPIVSWLYELDHEMTGKNGFYSYEQLIERYLEHLKGLIHKKEQETLHPGHFAETSVIFKKFVWHLIEQHGYIMERGNQY